LWRGLALLAFFASPLALLVDTANMAGVSLRAAISFLPQVMRETHLGRVSSWSVPLIVALVIAVWTPGRWALKPIVVGVLSCALLLLGSLSGHAIDKGTAAVVVYFIHEMAAGLWIGALCGLWIGGMRGKFGETWVRQTAPRVSNLTGWAVSALILSGLYTAYHALDADPYRLIYAAYGRTLVAKICAVSLAIMIGAYNRYRLMPAVAASSSPGALLRNVGVEFALLIGVLGLAALLANTPPAH
jgi:putative copper export protein